MGDSVFTPSKKRNSAEMRVGGLWERKSNKGKISVLWLLFETVLAAPKQTAGLGKNTPQTGGKVVEKFSWQLLLIAAQLFPSGLSPRRKSQDRARESSAAGKGRGVCGRWGLGILVWGSPLCEAQFYPHFLPSAPRCPWEKT